MFVTQSEVVSETHQERALLSVLMTGSEPGAAACWISRKGFKRRSLLELDSDCKEVTLHSAD